MAETSESTNTLTNLSNKDKVILKLIRVSGQTHTFYFLPTITATEISNYVFENWPEEWTENRGESAALLKLIYQGRFLHSNTTLVGLQLPVGKTTVMHLVSRETVPEPQSADKKNDSKARSSNCRLCCCSIL